jgi:hypothetical protein
METALQRKIRSKVNMKRHLEQMNYLSTIPVLEKDLLSLEESDHIYSLLQNNKITKQQFFFKPILQNQILYEIKRYLLTIDEKCYILCQYSFDCGVYVIESIRHFKPEFNYIDLGFYRVTLLSMSMQNEITFWEEDEGTIEIEVSGDNWISIVSDIQNTLV